jgi:amidohydrolase
VIGVLHGDLPGRTIAWRADMDALPIVEAIDGPFRSTSAGVMHACGHDGHTAIAVILAELLATRRATLPGTLVLLFQPAEEVFGGAQPMLDAGVLDTYAIEEIYGLHLTSRMPVGRVEACPGVSMASADVIELDVRGRGGHGALPGLAIDPIVIAAQILVGLHELVTDPHATALTFGQIAAGTAPNIIPDHALLRGTLRALHARDRDALLARAQAYVAKVATNARASATLRTIGACCPALSNHAEQTQRVHTCAASELGPHDVAAGEPVLASDDMSLFLARRPGCYFRVGAAPEGKPPPPHHSPEFELHEDGLGIAARVAAQVLLHALAG